MDVSNDWFQIEDEKPLEKEGTAKVSINSIPRLKSTHEKKPNKHACLYGDTLGRLHYTNVIDATRNSTSYTKTSADPKAISTDLRNILNGFAPRFP